MGVEKGAELLSGVNRVVEGSKSVKQGCCAERHAELLRGVVWAC